MKNMQNLRFLRKLQILLVATAKLTTSSLVVQSSQLQSPFKTFYMQNTQRNVMEICQINLTFLSVNINKVDIL